MGFTRSSLAPHAFNAGDAATVLEVVNADLVQGQPVCTESMLADAVAGHSVVDGGWWAELEAPTTEVLTDPAGVIRGVVSYARRPRDNAGVILWLHGIEDRTVIGALADHAITQLAGVGTLEAFAFATALSVGLEGLPARHRPTTRAVLTARGFAEADLWRYMHRHLPARELPAAADAQIIADPERHGWTVRLDAGAGTTAGEAEVSLAADGLGVLWWIGVDPAHRGQGLGRRLLGTALDLLHRQGAHEVILFVDDDAPANDPERGRGAANALYDRAGFTEVDRLCSYQRTRSSLAATAP